MRELVSKIQTQRKESDFEVTDRIDITVKTTDKLAQIITAAAEDIKKGVLALSIGLGDAAEGASVKEWDINGEKAEIGIKVAK